MKSNNLILTLAALFLIIGVQAQKNVDWKKENFPGKESEFEKAFKTYEEGNKIFYDGGPPYYEAALVKYQEAYVFNPDNDYLNFHMGHIYFALHHPHDAEKYYERAILLNPELREQILYELAVSYHQDADWDGAIAHYKEYKNFIQEGGHKHLNMHSKDVAHEVRWVDLCIKQCETGKIISHDTIPIIFENISPAINSKYPEYSAVVNHNEDLLIFVSRRPGNTGDRDNHGSVFEFEDVYVSRRDANGWSKAEHLHGDVNSHAHEAPVWVSGDGTRLLLYFNKSKTKDPKKQGDIYESDFVDGKWTDPRPVKAVNSSWRETHASMSNDGKTIYFTTNNPKWAKHGGMDIVKTTLDATSGEWSEPVDIGSKINTEWDEESPFIKPDGKHFYFSSQGHTSVGGFDFFRCELQENGQFSEPINMGIPLNTPFDDAFIYFSDDGKRVYFNSNRDGGFGAQDIYEGFIMSEIAFPVKITLIDGETNDTIKTASTVLMKRTYDQSLVDLTDNKNGTFTSTVGIMKNFDVKVTAEGYDGTEFTLSTKFDQLVNFDTIVVQRNVYLKKDYAPVAFHGQLFDKVTGNPVEGIVEVTVGNSNEKIAHVQTVNTKYTCDVARNKEYTVTALSKGHMPYRETFKITAKNNKKDFYLDRIKVGDRFAMRNVQYESGKATLKQESITELEILKEFMTENPYIKLEVSAHTDIVGSHAMNMKLSLARAKSIYTWLTANGIAKERITFKGYGPDLPVATNDTPEGRALNRRAEIKILEEH
jgi:outer membrane protein OmpA-like peptidoglycan-associated protein